MGLKMAKIVGKIDYASDHVVGNLARKSGGKSFNGV